MVLPSILAYWNINNYQITDAINNPVFFKSTYNKLLLFGKIFNTPDLIDVSNNSQYIKFEGGVGSEGNYLSTIASEKITYDDNFTYEGDNFSLLDGLKKIFLFLFGSILIHTRLQVIVAIISYLVLETIYPDTV